ncbi:hypothetical protein LguiA_003827 [Lonicera macranthoides]
MPSLTSTSQTTNLSAASESSTSANSVPLSFSYDSMNGTILFRPDLAQPGRPALGKFYQKKCTSNSKLLLPLSAMAMSVNMKRSRSPFDLGDSYIPKRFKRAIVDDDDIIEAARVNSSAQTPEERIMDDEGEAELHQGNEDGSICQRVFTYFSNLLQILLAAFTLLITMVFPVRRVVDEDVDREEPSVTSTDHEERPAEEGEHQTDATPSNLREDGSATLSESVEERAVAEGEHQTDATPRDLREVSRATSSEIVELGAADEGEHQTDAAPSNLREAGDAPSSQSVEEGKFEGRITRTIVMCGILVLTSGLLMGYTNGILVAVLNMDDFIWDMFPSLREGNQHANVNNKCKHMNHKQQFLSSSMSLISIPSFLASAFLCFKYGRKSMLYLALLAFIIGIAMNVIASGKFMLLAGRAILSIGVGFYSQVIPVLIDELTHSAVQDPLFLAFQVANSVGILGSNVTAYFFNNVHDLGWRYAIIVMIVPWLILAGVSYFIPETPTYLLWSGSVEEGKATLMKIRGLPNVNAELQKLEETIVSFRNFRVAFLEVWRLSSRPILYILLVSQILQQVCGANAIVYFGSLVFTSLGFSDEASLISSTSSVVVCFIGTIIDKYLVNKLGRKWRLLIAFSLMSMTQSINAILLSDLGSDRLVPRAKAIGIAVLCALYSFNFALVSSPLGWLGVAYPPVVRILGVVPPTSSNFALNMIIAQLSQVMMCRLQIWIYIIYAILNAIGALIIWFFIPETTGILLGLMIERVWRRHWLWKLYFPNRNRDDPPADV